MKNLLTVSASLFIVLTAVPAFANVTVRTERTAAGQTYQVTVYILGEVSGREPDHIDRRTGGDGDRGRSLEMT